VITVSLGEGTQAECPHCRAILEFEAVSFEDGFEAPPVLPRDYDPDDPEVKRSWNWTRRGVQAFYAGTLSVALAVLIAGASYLSNAGEAQARWFSVASNGAAVLAVMGTLAWLLGAGASSAVPVQTGAKGFALFGALTLVLALVGFGLATSEAFEPWASLSAPILLLVSGLSFATYLAKLGEFLRHEPLERQGRAFAIFLVATAAVLLVTGVVAWHTGNEIARVADRLVMFLLFVVGVVLGVRLLSKAELVVRRSGGRPLRVRVRRREPAMP